PFEVVHPIARLGHQLLGAERGDLADRGHQSGLARAKTTPDEYLHRLWDHILGVRVRLIVCGYHRVPPEVFSYREAGTRAHLLWCARRHRRPDHSKVP